MPVDTNNAPCQSQSAAKGAAGGPVNPFYAVSYHFGMLLGVDDFETEQGYHRGKSRLHNAWLHGHGVVWGLGVSAAVVTDEVSSLAAGEVAVDRGLALDPVGRELYLPQRACLSLPAWFVQHQSDADLQAVLQVTGGTPESPTGVTFDAIVVAKFKACLTREVPALVEPCQGASSDTQFSRVSEQMDLFLVPVASDWAPQWSEAYRRLRVLFGLLPLTSEDADVLAEAQAIAALPENERREALLAALRSLGAIDARDRGPATGPDGTQSGLFPGLESDVVVLAHIGGIGLTLQDDAWVLTAADVDNTVAPCLLPTAAIQELLCGAGLGVALDAGGPRVDPASVTIDSDTDLSFSVDQALYAGTVQPAAISVSSLAPITGGASAWQSHAVSAVSYSAGSLLVKLALDAGAPLSASDVLVRIIVKGTGSAPILGENLAPLAGALGSAPVLGPDGRDFVWMAERSAP